MPTPQLDLFGKQQLDLEELMPVGFDPPPPDFVARIRDELQGTLSLARQAARLPWPDLTRATIAELRFHSIVRWLPEDEQGPLRVAFEAEMARLYDVEDNWSVTR